MVCESTIQSVVVLLLLAASALASSEHTPAPEIHSCPDLLPVRCIDAAGEFVGCCPQWYECNAVAGLCTHMAPQGTDEAGPVVPMRPASMSVYLLPASLVRLCILAVGFASFCFAVAFVSGWLGDLWVRRILVAQRAAALRDADALGQDSAMSSADDESVTSESEAAFLASVQVREEGASGTAGAVEILCLVCSRGAVDCLLTPCNHTVACAHCAFKLRHCPLCHAKIGHRVKLFM